MYSFFNKYETALLRKEMDTNQNREDEINKLEQALKWVLKNHFILFLIHYFLFILN